jgi:hypothetical protein
MEDTTNETPTAQVVEDDALLFDAAVADDTVADVEDEDVEDPEDSEDDADALNDTSLGQLEKDRVQLEKNVRP